MPDSTADRKSHVCSTAQWDRKTKCEAMTRDFDISPILEKISLANKSPKQAICQNTKSQLLARIVRIEAFRSSKARTQWLDTKADPAALGDLLKPFPADRMIATP